MSTVSASYHERISAHTRELKLPGIRHYYQEAMNQAVSGSLGYDEYLLNLLDKEMELRQERRRQSRIRQAGFPNKCYLQDLEVGYLPEDAQHKLKLLRTLEFIESGRNVILAGNPGTGKTHLAIGLGIEACLRNLRVLFTSVPTLITQLKECRSERTLRTFQNRFESWDLVICDEFGYISFDKEGAELLFMHLSLRSGRKSIIITTNLSFDRWQELFGDPVLTAAMVDRLTHKAHLVNMNGNSYRIKETQEWINTVQ
jgi:DNA replication protein DnaC